MPLSVERPRQGLSSGQKLYVASADWMRRNLNRRIETAFPIFDPKLRQEVIDMLHIQLADNVKACRLDSELQNCFKRNPNAERVRSQVAFYEYLKQKNEK